METLVTGGAGFIGSHLVRGLMEKGHGVRVLDDFSSGRRKNIEPILDRIVLIEGDIADPDTCRSACEGVEVVFHEAASPSVPKSIDNPAATHRSNIEGTFNMLLAARDVEGSAVHIRRQQLGLRGVGAVAEDRVDGPLAPESLCGAEADG